MFDNKSIYALNKKDPDAIVYRDAEGNIIRLTRRDFESEEEFLKFKRWSDEDYRQEENREQRHGRRTVSLTSISEQSATSPSVEESIDEKLEEMRTDEIMKLLGSDSCGLSEIQRRRVSMYYEDRMSEEEIAEKEHISQQAVSKSLRAGMKTLKNFLKKF